MNEAAWIRQCQSSLVKLVAARSPLRPALDALCTQYRKEFPYPKMHLFFQNIQLKAAIDSRDDSLLRELLPKTTSLNTITLNLLLNYYRQSGRMAECEDILEKAIGRVLVNRASFSTVIAGWAAAGNVERVAAWYGRLLAQCRAEGDPKALQPDIALLVLVVEAHSLANSFERADEILEERSQSLFIEWPVWAVLLKGLVSKGCIDKARTRHNWLVAEYFRDRLCPRMFSDILVCLKGTSPQWEASLCRGLRALMNP